MPALASALRSSLGEVMRMAKKSKDGGSSGSQQTGKKKRKGK